MKKKYSIQGFEGSFHEEAAQKYFGSKVQVTYCPNFRQTFMEPHRHRDCTGAVVAIENSIAGSILPNYTLLQKSRLYVVGEIILKIKQQLLVNKGVRLEQIKEVHSHPMALYQCDAFLAKHNFKLVETEDTALSARYIKQHRCKHIAAIASTLAAKQQQLDILVPDIHTEKNNYTRFLVLEKEPQTVHPSLNKASIYIETNHTQGSLAKVLTLIAALDINISKLQSFPVAGSRFKYYFHIDIEFEQIEQFHAMDQLLSVQTSEYKVYGLYKKWQSK